MDTNLLYVVLFNATLCLILHLALLSADYFELDSDTIKPYYSCVESKTHKRSICKRIELYCAQNLLNVDTDKYNTDSYTLVSSLISTWLILIASARDLIWRRTILRLSCQYPEPLSTIGLPDEQMIEIELNHIWRLWSGPDDTLNGRARTVFNQWIESCEHFKQSTLSTRLSWSSLLSTEDYENSGSRAVEFSTKSEAYICDNHLVLTSRNELFIDKDSSLTRLRLRDELERETATIHEKRSRVTIYQSPTLVFWWPLDTSPGTDHSNLFDCASNFSTLMQIIIVTLLLEITRNGLPKRSFNV